MSYSILNEEKQDLDERIIDELYFARDKFPQIINRKKLVSSG